MGSWAHSSSLRLKVRVCKAFLVVVCFWIENSVFAAEKDDEIKNKTVLDDAPFVSPRAGGLGLGLSPLADGVDAAYYNPAGIGGLHVGKEKQDTVRQFYFPYAGAAMNNNSQELYNDMSKAGALTDSELATAVLDAHEGKRQFAHASLFPNAGFGRFMLGPIASTQIAAVPQGNGTGLVDLHYQERYGFGAGLSVTEPKERLYLGAFSQYLTIKDVEGEYEYADVVTAESRKEAFKEDENRYAGISTHVGAIMRLADRAKPVLSVAVRNLGGARYFKTKGEGDSQLKAKQDIASGFGVSPQLAKYAYFNFALEVAHIEDADMDLAKKFHSGMELTLGSRRGSNSILGLRTGVNSAGAGFGVNLNLGIIGVQYSNYAEDVGANDARVIERRQAVVGSINLAN